MERMVGADYISLNDLNRRLNLTKSICDSDPLAIWEEDGEKIKLLADTIRSMKLNSQPGVEDAERALEVMRWKRCDLGRRLLKSVPAGDGQTIWSEMIETSKHKAKAGIY
ncbi:MAG: hypothetical protein ACE14P_00010 [Methanotrichaceae archaeon]